MSSQFANYEINLRFFGQVALSPSLNIPMNGSSQDVLRRVEEPLTLHLSFDEATFLARKTWLATIVDNELRKKAEETSFLCFVDAQRRYADFHALRKTFITNLSKSGVSPKMAQSLARHSDINLTMNVYTDVVLEDQAIAVELLPELPVLLQALMSTSDSGILQHLDKIRERATTKVVRKNKSV